MTGPELDVRWRRFSVSAKGREAIDAIRTPLFVFLLVNAGVMAFAVIAALVRPDWAGMTGAVGAWLR